MILNPVNEDFVDKYSSARLSERDFERYELDEMAGLRKTTTGLPVNIWLDCNKTYIQGGHGKRIKFQNDRGNNMNEDNLISMTISRDDPQIPENQLPKVKLPAKDIEALKSFVRNNARELSKLADNKIDIIMFSRKMKTS